MDDAGPVEGGDSAGHARGELRPFLIADARLPFQPLFQRLAVIKGHHRIEPGLAFGRLFDHLADPRTAHPAGDESLVDEGAAIDFFRGDARLRKFEHHLRAIAQILRAHQETVAPVGEKRLNAVIVDQIAEGRRREDRQFAVMIADFRLSAPAACRECRQ